MQCSRVDARCALLCVCLNYRALYVCYKVVFFFLNLPLGILVILTHRTNESLLSPTKVFLGLGIIVLCCLFYSPPFLFFLSIIHAFATTKNIKRCKQRLRVT